MKPDWRTVCTLSEIYTPISINKLKRQRKKLKKKLPLWYCKGNITFNENLDFTVRQQIRKLSAIIKGKQFIYVSKLQYIPKFDWSFIDKFARTRR